MLKQCMKCNWIFVRGIQSAGQTECFPYLKKKVQNRRIVDAPVSADDLKSASLKNRRIHSWNVDGKLELQVLMVRVKRTFYVYGKYITE